MVITSEYLNAHTPTEPLIKPKKNWFSSCGQHRQQARPDSDTYVLLWRTRPTLTSSPCPLWPLIVDTLPHRALALTPAHSLLLTPPSPHSFYCSLTCRVRVNLAQIRDETRRDWRLPLAQVSGLLAAHLACLVSCQLARFGNEMWKKKKKRREKWTSTARRVALHLEYALKGFRYGRFL